MAAEHWGARHAWRLWQMVPQGEGQRPQLSLFPCQRALGVNRSHGTGSSKGLQKTPDTAAAAFLWPLPPVRQAHPSLVSTRLLHTNARAAF